MARTKNDPRAHKIHAILKENLKAARERAKLTQVEAGQKAKLDPNAISRWESSGGTVPDIAAVKMLADIYGVSMDDMVAERPKFLMDPANRRDVRN